MNNLKMLPKVIGTKQTLRAIETGQVKAVILAADTDPDIQSKIRANCQKAQIQILSCDSKHALGIAGGINRDAAVIAILGSAD